jgi:hypothetical protein
MDDWQIDNIRFPLRPPPWDGRGVSFDYLKASPFDDSASSVIDTATAATDQDGWSKQSLYFGNGAVLTDLKQPLTLSERASEAAGKYVYEVKFQPGYTVNVDALHNGQGIDYRGRARYLVFLGRVVALHPDEDLKIVGRTVVKVLKYNPHHDERGRFTTGDGSGGTTISSDIPGQVDVGGAGPLFSAIPGHPSILDVKPQKPKVVDESALPKGYTIDPVADPKTGVVDYAVMYEGHGVIGQFDQKISAVEYAHEHAATATPATPLVTSVPNQSSLSINTAPGADWFHLGAEHLPEDYTVEPGADNEGGFNVHNKDGLSVTHGVTAAVAVANYFNGHPEMALPEGFTYVQSPFSHSILDTHGTAVWVASSDQKPADTIEDFLNSSKAPGIFTNTGGSLVQTKPMGDLGLGPTPAGFQLSSYSLPTGYTAAQDSAGSQLWGVKNAKGEYETFGTNEKEAVNNFFDSHPQSGMPDGYTWVSGNILNAQGEVVHSQIDPAQKPSQAIEEFLNSPKAPSEFHIGDGTAAIHAEPAIATYTGTSAPGTPQYTLASGMTAGHTPYGELKIGNSVLPDVKIEQVSADGGYKITNQDGFKLGEGDTAEHALDNFMATHPSLASTIATEFGLPAATSKPSPPIGVDHLPKGYKVVDDTAAGGSVKVQDEGGNNLVHGDTQAEALHNYFTAYPNTALPDGFTTDYNPFKQSVTILDEHGMTVHEEFQPDGDQKTYDVVANYLAGKPSTFDTSGSLPPPKFVPGEEHLPPGVYLNEHAGGYSPVKVLSSGGSVLGAGQTKEEALHEYFTYHAGSMLPAGYKVDFDSVADVPIITDPAGNEVLEGKPGQGSYDAVVSYLTANPGLAAGGTPSATATAAPKFQWQPGIGNLPEGYKVEQDPSPFKGQEFKIKNDYGETVAYASTQDAALHEYFDQHPNEALPEGINLHNYHYGNDAATITDSHGATLWTAPAGVYGLEAVTAYMSRDQPVTSLADLPESFYLGPGRPGLEPLGEAGLPPGFNVTHERGGDTTDTYGDTEAAPPSSHQITSDEKQAVYDYTGVGNASVNKLLRDGIKPDSPGTTNKRIKLLDQIFSDTSTSKDMILHRCISSNAVARLEEAIKHTDGHFVDPGFVSASTKEHTAEGWKSGDYVTITVPRGSKAIDADPMSQNPGEGEWIMARNQHFQITGKEPTHSGLSYGHHTHYFAKLVNKITPKDTRQLDLPFIDRGPVNKQDEGAYDPNEKFTWDESGIVPTLPEDIVSKYNEVHDPHTGEFASGPGSQAYIERAARFMQRVKGELQLGVEGTNPNAGIRQVDRTPITTDDSPELPMVMPQTPPSGPLVFHGTSQEALASIEANGLVARGGAGADQWAQEHPEYFSPGGTDPGVGSAMVTKFADKPANLFVASNPETAIRYAGFAAKLTGSTPVLIPVHLSQNMARMLSWDAAGHEGEMKLDGDVHIPKEWLGKPAVGTAAMTEMLANYYRMPKSVKLPVPFETGTPSQILPNVDERSAHDVMGKAGDVVVYLVFFVAGIEKYNPHHDEHGRFSSGDGVPSGDIPLAPHLRAQAETQNKKAKNLLFIRQQSKELGFDPDRVDLMYTPRTFELNGKKYDYAGAAYPSGDIELWPDEMRNDQFQMRQVLAHEIMHERFNDFVAEYEKQSEEVRLANQGHNSTWDMEGHLTPEYAAKWPLFAEVNNRNLFSGTKMAEGDGITSYSKEWWKAWGDSKANTSQAITETLAEMAASAVRDHKPNNQVFTSGGASTYAPSNEWLRLAELVNENWDRKHPT